MEGAYSILHVLAASCVLLASCARGDLQLLQWNPHWQCFAWNSNDCAAQARKSLQAMLQGFDVDFANLIEFEDDGFSMPAGWTSIRSSLSCGKDRLDLVYRSTKWRPAATTGAGAKGCMVQHDRPFIVQQFDSIGGSDSIIVVGAHFPHPASNTDSTLQADVLQTALQDILAVTGIDKVVLLADTNESPSVSSSRLMSFLGIPGETVSTSLQPTCCFDNSFPSWGTFDRIIANFGLQMQTQVLHDPLPTWAHEVQLASSRRGAFHKAIKGVLVTDDSTFGGSSTAIGSSTIPATTTGPRTLADTTSTTSAMASHFSTTSTHSTTTTTTTTTSIISANSSTAISNSPITASTTGPKTLADTTSTTSALVSHSSPMSTHSTTTSTTTTTTTSITSAIISSTAIGNSPITASTTGPRTLADTTSTTSALVSHSSPMSTHSTTTTTTTTTTTSITSAIISSTAIGNSTMTATTTGPSTLADTTSTTSAITSHSSTTSTHSSDSERGAPCRGFAGLPGLAVVLLVLSL
eukprot:TRINITY_DN10374_c3_g1_i4.p1 TRINITY_DN10374_c3_g1~~TRINITY_DN10374_c3_g1_i4.p1  ORF type:complete len:523 (+),score=94.89 TRINITY_DN10374_c3_g1_i4:23-1591(+)